MSMMIKAVESIDCDCTDVIKDIINTIVKSFFIMILFFSVSKVMKNGFG